MISIIALLIALLMPAMRRAKEQVRNTTCLTNVRQIALACVSYSGDHKGLSPPGIYPGLAHLGILLLHPDYVRDFPSCAADKSLPGTQDFGTITRWWSPPGPAPGPILSRVGGTLPRVLPAHYITRVWYEKPRHSGSDPLHETKAIIDYGPGSVLVWETVHRGDHEDDVYGIYDRFEVPVSFAHAVAHMDVSAEFIVATQQTNPSDWTMGQWVDPRHELPPF